MFSSVEFIASKCTRSCVKHTWLNDVSTMSISVAISDLLARGLLSHITRLITRQITHHITCHITLQITRHITRQITCQITRQIIIICHGLLGAPYFCKDYWAFFGFEFSRSQLINIHEKIGTREKSPDNRIVRIVQVRL